MTQTRQKILLLVVALACGAAFPYLMEMASRAVDVQPAAPDTGSPEGLSASQRLILACTAVQQLNQKLGKLDPNQPSFLSDMAKLQKVKPELQNIHRIVCGK